MLYCYRLYLGYCKFRIGLFNIVCRVYDVGALHLCLQGLHTYTHDIMDLDDCGGKACSKPARKR